ncbi:MAG TPA: UDP-3-O-(3-hydroxymyristoyl)glucosamine N-acyltransferase [Bryobacteraceae bacterium]|nr:UDP-3-O-(3-hydroxymyristoyl)glucosamine N-acyltransferase [Bryobacteraceae bacterium]
MALTVAQLAEICGGTAEGDTSRTIEGANALEHATASDLSFAGNKKAIEAAAHSRAGCLLVPPSFDGKGAWALIRVAEPRVAFVRGLHALYPKKTPAAGIHPTAVLAPGAEVAADCFIGAHASVGEGARIASRCSIGNGCVIGEGVDIGSGTVLHPHVTLYRGVKIGARVILHAGCVVGADGFGFTLVDDHYEKFPQVGTVEIDDDVEIGANSCVDRAALGVTRIGMGTKLDNLVHVAHNCLIGKHVVVAAQTGFSGGVVVEDYATIGGQVGVGEKATIKARAVVGGGSGILTSATVRAGEPVWGMPARPLRKYLKGLAYTNKLPELDKIIRQLKQQMAEIESVENRKA